MCFWIWICSTPDFITPVDQQFSIDLDNKVNHSVINFLDCRPVDMNLKNEK